VLRIDLDGILEACQGKLQPPGPFKLFAPFCQLLSVLFSSFGLPIRFHSMRVHPNLGVLSTIETIFIFQNNHIDMGRPLRGWPAFYADFENEKRGAGETNLCADDECAQF
jgi:hypothetical protein